MSQIKRHLEATLLEYEEEINRARDSMMGLLNFEDFVSSLVLSKGKGLTVLALIIESLNNRIQEDPNFFLTCSQETLREYAKGILHGES